MSTSSNLKSLKLESEVARSNARRWYNEPDRVPIARRHDAEVEPRYSSFVSNKISGLEVTSPAIIDIGCGEGLLAQSLNDFSTYVGIDPDNSELHIDETRSRNNILFVRAGVENIPPNTPSADIIVSSLNLALWDDPSLRCAELQKQLNPGGHILIVDLLRTSPRIQRSAGDDLSQFLIDQYNASLTIEEVDALCHSVLPGAGVTTYTDERDAIVLSADNTSNFGKLFLIHYQEA